MANVAGESGSIQVTTVAGLTVEAGANYSVDHLRPEPYAMNWDEGRVLPEFHLFHMPQGRGVFESRATGNVHLEAGMSIVIFPGSWHRYRPLPDTGWTEYSLTCGGPFIEEIMSQKRVSTASPVLRLRRPEMMADGFNAIFQRVPTSFLSSQRLSEEIEPDIRRLIDLLEDNEPVKGELAGASDDPVVNKAIQLIWSTSHRALTIDWLANEVHICRRSLERRFRDKLGRSIFAEISRCRVHRAEQFLVQSDLSLEQIASKSGFPNALSMRMAIKRQMGKTPAELRASRRSQGSVSED